ncbi:uncharacterized protein DUF742 [Streptomyces sp. KhCrAH-43]|uniref:DUF742 domain-containing protein n=1 Tax=Streptomyces tropicalis TaxID=3034234 RepID=A0ABT6AFA0_9ACTN|nr:MULTISPECIES: DUF742 domain-containing protein [Streptomyces]MDF3303327.1 DUF742 domain-containing protein [Streptomyces tropicalis]MYS33616.1 DUF742 domain-containing protein [Streptomyces sp. SID4920]MYX63791.1 DUF742 domain-containing protein [Streptomyces sp. SID8373]RAJ52857.1 uncharacterized protein DUF742 [Streptomyces sp. KhCrAH-43]
MTTPPGGRRSRPYAGTGGRIQAPTAGLTIDTQITVSGARHEQPLSETHLSVLRLCSESSRAVSELAGLLQLPVGVITVLVADLDRLRLVTLQAPADMSRLDNVSYGLITRVLNGLKAQYQEDIKGTRRAN